MLTFCRCTTNDYQYLCELSEKTYKDTFAVFCSEETMQAYLEEAFCETKIIGELSDKHSEFYFAKNDDTVVGYIKVNEFEAQSDIKDHAALELERIYIFQDYQNQGYGKELLEKAVSIAAQKGKAYVWLGVWEKNEKAIGFYRKNGFEISGEHIFVMGEERQRDYIMKKEIFSKQNNYAKVT
ncbi:MAG: GNAT family N-acetyltransferase [Clostridiaceae bacterium]|nr:GNAT family N-acetyltransferase [Clostridiaceae bacterium]